METKILKESDLFLAAEELKRGNPIVFPTETVYGLGASLFDEKAIEAIFKIKGRPLDNPLIAHVASTAQAESIGENIPSAFYRLAQRFWPGPLTLVVKRRAEVPSLASAGGPTIAIRFPAHPVARKLIEAVGKPLVAPSANLSGRPSPTRVRDVWEDLNGKVAYIVEGGECSIGIESTVLSLYEEVPTLLRPGQITREEIESVLGRKIALASLDTPVHSPGMKYRHYAPRASVQLVFREEDLRAPFLLSPVPIPGKKVHLLNAQTLYAALREADRLGADEIDVYCDSSIQANAALMNRLLRASESKNH